MHRLIWIPLSAALLFAYACSRTQEEEIPAAAATGTAQEEAPAAVQLGLSQPALVDTKAAVDNWSGNETLYIYGFPFVNGALDLEHPFIDNVAANSPASGTTGLINLHNPAAHTDSPLYDEPFYYAENVTYDFYGYYVANGAYMSGGKPLNQYNNDNIYQGYYVNLNINGTQDIMVGKTDRVKAAEGGVAYQRIYSAYAARRGVQPELTFQHVLSRFKFRFQSGSQTAHNDVTVDGIEVESNSQGFLFVAGPSADGTILYPSTPSWMDLGLTQAIGLPVPGETGEVRPESIMVIPGESSYKLRLHINQLGVTDSPSNTQELEIDFAKLTGSTDQVATAGHQYLVTLVVYGLEEVMITVSLTDWEMGGEVEIDPDQDFFVSASNPAVVSANGANLEIPITALDEFTPVVNDSWIHVSNTAPSPVATKVTVTQSTLYVTVDPNPGHTRVGRIHFYVNGKPDTSISITQEGALDIPDTYGIYPMEGAPYVFNPATELISVYEANNQCWSRFLFPATNTVYELGPIPPQLWLGQEFSASFTQTVNGQVTASRNATLRVIDQNGRNIKLLDTARMDGYTIIY